MTIRNEEREQSNLIIWSHRVAVRAVLPQLRWLHHSPNGGKRDAFTGAQMKAMGVKAGFPDLILPVRATADNLIGQHPGLIIEMKSDIGRLSAEQKEWREHFLEQNWDFRVARSAQEARSHLCQYLGMAENQVPPL